jgi:hypothetical protein
MAGALFSPSLESAAKACGWIETDVFFGKRQNAVDCTAKETKNEDKRTLIESIIWYISLVIFGAERYGSSGHNIGETSLCLKQEPSNRHRFDNTVIKVEVGGDGKIEFHLFIVYKFTRNRRQRLNRPRIGNRLIRTGTLAIEDEWDV